jgi:3-phosphoshikimate 1-carboxyvinyltransferase
MKVTAPNNYTVSGNIELPGSKSIANRALIIKALSRAEITLHNLSPSKDTEILQALLEDKKSVKDCGMAGTTFRFLTAFYSTQAGKCTLTGSERMLQRPIAPLVEALNSLGASIEYTQKSGYPPLSIVGGKLSGGKVSLPAHISSQFVSALMLIAPELENSTEIHLQTAATSRPYIEMTAALMKHFGAEVYTDFEKGIIQINKQPYQGGALTIEGDWSAASYYYSILALAENGSIELSPLSSNNWQGDSIVSDIYYRLGVSTIATETGFLLEKTKHKIDYLEYDFTDCPDLAQTVICTCAGLGIEGEFSGLHTLRIKETDRIAALQNELQKLGWNLQENGDTFSLQRNGFLKNTQISTYHDHRMAMSFAPLSLVYDSIEIENPSVVEKSNPDFWKHLQILGFQLES